MLLCGEGKKVKSAVITGESIEVRSNVATGEPQKSEVKCYNWWTENGKVICPHW